MKPKEAYERALQEVPRDESGQFDEDELISLTARLITIDEDEEKRRLAKTEIRRHTRPGETPPKGQLAFPGMRAYGYEPDRLVADDDGHLIENYRSRPAHKSAEAQRARENEEKVRVQANRKQREAALFAEWAMEQMESDRSRDEITWDVCVRETDVWQDGDAA